MLTQDDFTEFMHVRWPTLVRTAMFLGNSPEDAQDVAQTALMNCYRSWGRVTAAREPDSYVFQCLFNAHRDLARRRRRTRPSDHLHASVPGPDEQVTLQEVIREVLRDLNLEQRKVVTLRILIGFPERQTAAILDIPAGTVKSRLARALDILARNPQLLRATIEKGSQE